MTNYDIFFSPSKLIKGISLIQIKKPLVFSKNNVHRIFSKSKRNFHTFKCDDSLKGHIGAKMRNISVIQHAKRICTSLLELFKNFACVK